MFFEAVSLTGCARRGSGPQGKPQEFAAGAGKECFPAKSLRRYRPDGPGMDESGSKGVFRAKSGR